MSHAINLNEEIELRARLRVEFERLSTKGLSPIGAQDLNALAELLHQVIETRKQAEKQEKELKAELRRHFLEGSEILDCGPLMAFVDRRTRTDLDRKALTEAFGADALAPFVRSTNYETLTLKKKEA